MARHQRFAKRRLSQFPGEASCNQEETGSLKQGLDNVALAVIAQGQAFVLQEPSIAAFDRPAPLAQARAVRPAPLVEVRLGPERPAGLAVALGVVPLTWGFSRQ